MSGLNTNILGMAVSTFCMLLTRPDTGGPDLLVIFYVSLFLWTYFTIKVATHDPYE